MARRAVGKLKRKWGGGSSFLVGTESEHIEHFLGYQLGHWNRLSFDPKSCSWEFSLPFTEISTWLENTWKRLHVTSVSPRAAQPQLIYVNKSINSYTITMKTFSGIKEDRQMEHTHTYNCDIISNSSNIHSSNNQLQHLLPWGHDPHRGHMITASTSTRWRAWSLQNDIRDEGRVRKRSAPHILFPLFEDTCSLSHSLSSCLSH